MQFDYYISKTFYEGVSVINHSRWERLRPQKFDQDEPDNNRNCIVYSGEKCDFVINKDSYAIITVVWL